MRALGAGVGARGGQSSRMGGSPPLASPVMGSNSARYASYRGSSSNFSARTLSMKRTKASGQSPLRGGHRVSE